MNISFALTERQILARTKSETRRLWKEKTARLFVKDSIHRAWDKSPRVRGAKPIAEIRAVRDAYLQRLGDITTEQVAREGFPEMTADEFIEFFIGNSPRRAIVTRETLLWVAEFEVIKFL